MTDSVPPSVPPVQPPEPQITPEQLEMMKRIAKERAIQQVAEQQRVAAKAQQAPPGMELSMDGSQFAPPKYPPFQPPRQQQQPQPQPQPQVVYVRRPLTVAEIIIVFVISCGIVTGGQLIWQGLTNFLPRVEIRMK